jgi:hypothetical protein
MCDLQKKQELKLEYKNYPFMSGVIYEMMAQEKIRHFLSHYDITNYRIFIEGYEYYYNFEHEAINNNLKCKKCKDVYDIVAKYNMVHKFLKTKIGPDCSRQVVYEALKEDRKEDMNLKHSIQKMELENFFYFNELIIKYFRKYNVIERNRYIHMRFQGKNKREEIYDDKGKLITENTGFDFEVSTY